MKDLLRKQAVYGIDAPSHVRLDIDEARREIRRIKDALRRWGVEFEDLPYDEVSTEPPIISNPPSPPSRLKPKLWWLVLAGVIVSVIGIIVFTISSGGGGGERLQPGGNTVVASAPLAVTPTATSASVLEATTKPSSTEALPTVVSGRTSATAIGAQPTNQLLLSTTTLTSKTTSTTQMVEPTPNIPVELAQTKGQWKLIYNDTFRSKTNALNWDTWDYRAKTPDESTWKVSLEEEKYRIEVTGGKNGLEGRWKVHNVQVGDNFYIEMDIQKLAGLDTTYYGVLFHSTYDDISKKDNFYSLRISDDGSFEFLKVEADKPVVQAGFRRGSIDTLLSGQVNLDANEPNKIGILAKESKYKFYVNDVEIGEITDATLKGGLIGINTGHGSREYSIIEVDNFKLYAPM